MYYLKDASGNTVRTIQWDTNFEHLLFIYRHDTKRLETCTDTKKYDEQKIKYTLVDKVSSKDFEKLNYFEISNKSEVLVDKKHLTLVKESSDVLKNIDSQKDDEEKFKTIIQKTSLTGLISLGLIIGLGLIFKSEIKPKQELEVVQVLERKDIEKFIEPKQDIKKIVNVAEVKQKNPVITSHQTKKIFSHKPSPSKSSGLLGVLGSLNKSNQKGGLKIDQAEVSAGVGHGGKQGSGGVQTSVYAKGLFNAPLGAGNNAQGGGGYGTKGKGGGQAGYGKIQLVGNGGDSFFQPLNNEASVGGGLDRNEIAAVIQRHLSEVRYCYEQGLQKKPNLAGRVAIKFLIGPKGTVTLAQVDNSSMGQPQVDGCIRDRLKTWNFPKPEGGVTVKVTYPFILRRVSDS